MDDIRNEKTRTQLTIEIWLKEELAALAKMDDRSFNSYVVTVLKNHVKRLKREGE